MKKHYILLILFGILIFAACKKKDKAPAPPPAPVYTPPADGSPSNATSFLGIMTSGIYNSINNGSINTTTMANAWFGNQAEPAMYPSGAVKVNSVSLNGDTLSYSNLLKYYTTYTANLASETWSINGANGVPSFSINVSTTQPTCGVISLPDSISKASGFTVTINGVANTSYAYLFVYDGTGNLSGSYSAQINNGNNTVTVTSANLSSLATGNASAQVALILTNKRAYVFSGKDFQFSRETQFTKTLKIKS